MTKKIIDHINPLSCEKKKEKKNPQKERISNTQTPISKLTSSKTN